MRLSTAVRLMSESGPRMPGNTWFPAAAPQTRTAADRALVSTAAPDGRVWPSSGSRESSRAPPSSRSPTKWPPELPRIVRPSIARTRAPARRLPLATASAWLVLGPSQFSPVTSRVAAASNSI